MKLLLLSLLPSVLADFSGPSWSPPTDLTSNASLVSAAFTSLSNTLHQYITLDGSSHSTPRSPAGISNLTFSLGVFSLHDSSAADDLQFHYTAPEIQNSSYGTQTVDADSIYRIASVTKALTVLTGLVALNESDWDLSLADIFPALAAYSQDHPSPADPIRTVAWQDVTLRALAAQLGGVPRDAFPNANDLQIQALLGLADPLAMGLPPTTPDDALENPACLAYALATGIFDCPLTPFLETTANRPPVFAPWTTPAYANNGFALLGAALTAVTGAEDLGTLAEESVFGPLGMASSSIAPAPSAGQWARSVIAGGSPSTYFNISTAVLSGSGAGLSTQRDMARLGVGILNATLLSPAATQRWLKPVSLTGRLQYAVGAPWEIHRYTLPGSQKVVDLYSKLGDSGAYSALFVLLPDYGLGFSLLSAADPAILPLRFDVLAAIADIVTDTLLPAFEAQAAVDAARRFAGTYTDSSRNSSLTLAVNQTANSTAGPGLVIDRWTSNGTDVLASPLAAYVGPLPWRLVPSIDDSATHSRIGFRMISNSDVPSAQPAVGARLFSGVGLLAAEWILADVVEYGGIGTSLFEFMLDDEGRATAVSPVAFRMTLARADS